MKVVVIIPARFHSTRFEGKMLADIGGRTMIEHVYRRAKKVSLLSDLIVATDDERIRKAVNGFGGKVMMTAPDHTSGTDRVAEAASRLGLTKKDIVINVQGCEPFISPKVISTLTECMLGSSEVEMATVGVLITSPEELVDPNVVKVVFDQCGFALYFSRLPIPCRRGETDTNFYKHLGIYGYRKGFLEKLTALTPTPLEKVEGLEQLRVLENGKRIRIIISADDSISVDTPDDLERARAFYMKGTNNAS